MAHCLYSYFFQQFEQLLNQDKHKLLLEEPLVKEDCDFLRLIYLSCDENSTMLDLSSFSKEDVQTYGIVLNAFHSKNTGFIH